MLIQVEINLRVLALLFKMTILIIQTFAQLGYFMMLENSEHWKSISYDRQKE